jgi:hypothetical protein
LVTEATARFGAGLAGGVLIGLAVFRGAVFRPEHPAFECVTVGALAAGILALVRQARPGQAFALVVAFCGLRFALTPVVRLGAAVTGLLLGLGLFVVALIFDQLARDGWRFGKFLLVGPLVGGVFLALAPITELDEMNVLNAATLIMFRLALGMLIGEGVALGVELADWPLARAARAHGQMP